MSETLVKIQMLAQTGKILVSAHGYDELAADGIFFAEILDGLADAVPVEDYPDASKGPSVLVLQTDDNGKPVHVVWGILKDKTEPAVLITAYRPDSAKWSADFRKRKLP
ncbi:MAG: DUF4258 domain-containing protein [Rhizomicrobium sp.]